VYSETEEYPAHPRLSELELIIVVRFSHFIFTARRIASAVLAVRRRVRQVTVNLCVRPFEPRDRRGILLTLSVGGLVSSGGDVTDVAASGPVPCARTHVGGIVSRPVGLHGRRRPADASSGSQPQPCELTGRLHSRQLISCRYC